jgi:hypothetical protein
MGKQARIGFRNYQDMQGIALISKPEIFGTDIPN